MDETLRQILEAATQQGQQAMSLQQEVDMLHAELQRLQKIHEQYREAHPPTEEELEKERKLEALRAQHDPQGARRAMLLSRVGATITEMVKQAEATAEAQPSAQEQENAEEVAKQEQAQAEIREAHQDAARQKAQESKPEGDQPA